MVRQPRLASACGTLLLALLLQSGPEAAATPFLPGLALTAAGPLINTAVSFLKPAATSQRPPTISERREALVSAALRFGELTSVPYVWGGDAIGSTAECEACRTCIESKRRLSVQRRLKACKPCLQCGIDCTHFARQIYRDAGLDYPYASTRELASVSARKLRERYNLVNVGRNLANALPGDIILHPKHVVLLLDIRKGEGGSFRGDIVHVSRSIEAGGRAGGIEIVRGKDLQRFRGRVVKILRHAALDDGRRAVPPRRGRQPLPGTKGQFLS